jgi:hypothetical protein
LISSYEVILPLLDRIDDAEVFNGQSYPQWVVLVYLARTGAKTVLLNPTNALLHGSIYRRIHAKIV